MIPLPNRSWPRKHRIICIPLFAVGRLPKVAKGHSIGGSGANAVTGIDGRIVDANHGFVGIYEVAMGACGRSTPNERTAFMPRNHSFIEQLRPDGTSVPVPRLAGKGAVRTRRGAVRAGIARGRIVGSIARQAPRR